MDPEQSESSAALEASGTGLWSWHSSTGTVTVSPRGARQLGLRGEGPFDQAQWLEAVHPDDRARIAGQVAQAAVGTSIEHQVVRADGHAAWLRLTVYRVDAPPGAGWRRVAGTYQDITDLRLARRRIALFDFLGQDLYGGAADAAEIAYRAAEALGRALGVSRAGYGTVDKRAETITIERDWNAPGIRTLAGTLHFRDYGSYIEDLKRGETVVFDDARTDPRTRDTADALIAISAQAVVNMPVSEDGGLVALLYLNHTTARVWTEEEMSLVREVAHRTRQAVERRRAEDELRQLAASLEEQVQQRTRKLIASEAALHQAQKMEAVGQLTAGLAHDFNNLLAAVSGSLELLKRRAGANAATARYVEVGLTATRRAAALTHRLLAFSRQQTLEPRVVDVHALVVNFEDLIQRTIGPAIALEVRSAPTLWPVYADPAQLESALLNLCINARDAMPDGGRLVIEALNHAPGARVAEGLAPSDGPRVSICVRDTGCGMPPEVVARAFDPFFTTKPLGLGTGLGLSMVYGFAQQSGGVAHIASVQGRGSAVHLLLPAHQGAAVAESGAAEPATAGAVAASGTVVVVDDEAGVRGIMVEALRAMGFDVLEAADGPEAMKRLAGLPRPRLLVTDVGLPGGMNGRHLADAARVLFPGLGVLFVTGYAEGTAIGDVALPAGMQVLTKPFGLEAFGRRVQAMVGG